MPLYDYNVRRDYFEEAPRHTGLSFPCCCCIHSVNNPEDEPCKFCDHNIEAEPED